jgi:hypothetical protein
MNRFALADRCGPPRAAVRWFTVSLVGLTVLCPPGTSRADTEPVLAALEALFDGLSDPSPDPAVDERIADRLAAARPLVVGQLRLLESDGLIGDVDRLLADYATFADPRGTGTLAPPRATAAEVAAALATLARWEDLPTTRAVAPAVNLIAAMDLTLARRHQRRDPAGPPPEDVQLVIDRRAGELLQLDHDLVGVEGLRTDLTASTRAGKKLSALESDPAVAVIRLGMRRLVALGYTRVVDPRRGTGQIVSVP